ncbi:MAG: lipase family protein [Defluviitaleaceae bacterium]|nr:lipase family protein [Defluviitaleaceae bacterium]MCL2273700.1 lipase family protein [Defluviitaleaceae bacterium]
MKILPLVSLLLALAACGRNGEEEIVEAYIPEEIVVEEPEPEEEYIPYIPRITRVEGYFTGGGITEQFFWDEEYFARSAFEYCHSLATMSLALAMTTFASPRTDNVYELLDEIGFENIEFNDGFTATPTFDSIGVAVGHRYIQSNGESYTLLAVAVRGGNYGLEWVGNVTVGARGYHAGFLRGAAVVNSFLMEYLMRHGDLIEENVKVWITGFSRGAAVAALAAGRMSAGQRLGMQEILRENIFAYVFATPRFVPSQYNTANFAHIFNVINPADVVSWVAPHTWGFGRYGVDIMTPAYPSVVDVTRFDGVTIFPPSVQFVDGQQPTVAFMHGLVNAITGRAPHGVFINREMFAERFESDIQALLAQVVGGDLALEQFDGVMEDFLARFGMQNAPQMIRAFLSQGMDGLFDLAAQFLFDTLDEAGIEIAGRDAVREIVTASLQRGGLDSLLSLANNLEMIAHAHNPLIMFEWLMGRDENFGGEAEDMPFQWYREVVVAHHGDVDIQVFYADGQRAESYLHDGQHMWYFPPETAFIMEVTIRRGSIGNIAARNICYLLDFRVYQFAVSATDSVRRGETHVYRFTIPAYSAGDDFSQQFTTEGYELDLTILGGTNE